MDVNYNVSILEKSHDKELIVFLDNLSDNNPSVLGYHYPFYRNMLETIQVGKPLYIGAFDKENKLVAFLPGFIKTTAHGTVYSSLPFFGPNAGIICDYQDAVSEKLHALLLDFLFKELEQYDMISFSLYTSFNINEQNMIPIYDRLLGDIITVEKFTNYTNIDQFIPNSSLAYDIRKAKKSNVIITTEISENDIIELYKIYHQNCIDYQIPPKPKMCIDILTGHQHLIQNVKTYLAKIEEKIIGALIVIFSPTTASYYLPCSLHEFRSYQPTTLLIDYAINECKERKIKYWNWESSPSKDSGVFKFKKKWDSIDSQYKIYNKSYKTKEFYKTLGAEHIRDSFPYFFVYPFNLLS